MAAARQGDAARRTARAARAPCVGGAHGETPAPRAATTRARRDGTRAHSQSSRRRRRGARNPNRNPSDEHARRGELLGQGELLVGERRQHHPRPFRHVTFTPANQAPKHNHVHEKAGVNAYMARALTGRACTPSLVDKTSLRQDEQTGAVRARAREAVGAARRRSSEGEGAQGGSDPPLRVVAAHPGPTWPPKWRLPRCGRARRGPLSDVDTAENQDANRRTPSSNLPWGGSVLLSHSTRPKLSS